MGANVLYLVPIFYSLLQIQEKYPPGRFLSKLCQLWIYLDFQVAAKYRKNLFYLADM